MHNIDFIKSFICPHCQFPANFIQEPEKEGSIIDTSCPCKNSQVTIHSHSNYYVLYVNLIGPLQLQLHVEDNNLTVFQIVEYPKHDEVLNVAGLLHLALHYLPKNLNWNDINQLTNQIEILTTFQ